MNFSISIKCKCISWSLEFITEECLVCNCQQNSWRFFVNLFLVCFNCDVILFSKMIDCSHKMTSLFITKIWSQKPSFLGSCIWNWSHEGSVFTFILRSILAIASTSALVVSLSSKQIVDFLCHLSFFSFKNLITTYNTQIK